MGNTAHITLARDRLHVHLSDGTDYQRPAPGVIEFLRARRIHAADITMPDKDDPTAPTTGQRIAILSALRHLD